MSAGSSWEYRLFVQDAPLKGKNLFELAQLCSFPRSSLWEPAVALVYSLDKEVEKHGLGAIPVR